MTQDPIDQPGTETPPAQPPETISLTTAALDARLTRARASATSDFVSSLGFKTQDELTNAIRAQREAAEQQQTESERALARANEASAAATAATEALKTERVSRAVMEAALRAGIPGERIGAVTRLVDSSAVTVDSAGLILGADEAVTALVAENGWITAGVQRVVGTGAGANAQGTGTPASGLTEDQLWAAKVTGVSADRYAAAAQAKAGDSNTEYVAGTYEALARAARASQ